jgi:hypothetical protein
MGRRSRARDRDRAAAEAAARTDAGAQAPQPRRRNWARLLNPFKFRQLTRSRARGGAIGFGLSALLCMVLGRVFEDVAWYSSAVLLAILAVAWGVTAFLLPGDERSS